MFIILLFLSTALFQYAYAFDCEWDLSGLNNNKYPIFLTNNYKYVTLDLNKGIVLHNNQKLIGICAGKGNEFQRFSKQQVTISCLRGHLVNVNKNTMNITALVCKDNVKFSLTELSNDHHCKSLRGTKMSIGISLLNGTGVPLITICYDLKKDITLYARHVIEKYNHKIAYKRPSSFNKGILTNNYTEKYANRSNYQKRINSSSKTLEKGHLAPVADFTFNSHKDATFFYANAVPQWKDLNAGSWSKLERDIRNMALEDNRPVEVITGTHEVLKDVYGNPLYLANNTIPVPKYIWKVVCFGDADCISVVSHNTYNDSSSPPPLCRNVCGEGNHRWILNLPKTICCNVTQLKAIIHNIPPIKTRRVTMPGHNTTPSSKRQHLG